MRCVVGGLEPRDASYELLVWLRQRGVFEDARPVPSTRLPGSDFSEMFGLLIMKNARSVLCLVSIRLKHADKNMADLKLGPSAVEDINHIWPQTLRPDSRALLARCEARAVESLAATSKFEPSPSLFVFSPYGILDLEAGFRRVKTRAEPA